MIDSSIIYVLQTLYESTYGAIPGRYIPLVMLYGKFGIIWNTITAPDYEKDANIAWCEHNGLIEANEYGSLLWIAITFKGLWFYYLLRKDGLIK
jgi:hypothetical protein